MEIKTPMIRTILLHAASITAGAVAMLGFASSHSVDLYAAWNALNTIVADIGKFIALVTPIASAGYAIYTSTTKQKLLDLQKDDSVKGIIATPAVAASIPGDKVVASVASLPEVAKEAKE